MSLTGCFHAKVLIFDTKQTLANEGMEQFLIPGLRQKAPPERRDVGREQGTCGGHWLARLNFGFSSFGWWEKGVQLWNAAPAKPLSVPFHTVGCALVGAVVCRDPGELEAVPGVWGWLLLQGISATAQMSAAPCRQQIQTNECVCQLWACWLLCGRWTPLLLQNNRKL